MNDEKFLEEWNETIKRENCSNVDMKTGLKDCWSFPCPKNHTWRFYEIHGQPERSKREDSHSCEMRCSEHCGNTVREAQ